MTSEWAGDDDEGGAVSYGLVMPFVVVESVGGPFDDESFVAGYECGLFAEQLRSRHPSVTGISSTVHAGIVLQLDLIAMREGWTMTSEDSGTEGWANVDFRRAEPTVAEEPI